MQLAQGVVPSANSGQLQCATCQIRGLSDTSGHVVQGSQGCHNELDQYSSCSPPGPPMALHAAPQQGQRDAEDHEEGKSQSKAQERSQAGSTVPVIGGYLQCRQLNLMLVHLAVWGRQEGAQPPVAGTLRVAHGAEPTSLQRACAQSARQMSDCRSLMQRDTATLCKASI